MAAVQNESLRQRFGEHETTLTIAFDDRRLDADLLEKLRDVQTLLTAAGDHHSLEGERLVPGQLGDVIRFVVRGEQVDMVPNLDRIIAPREDGLLTSLNRGCSVMMLGELGRQRSQGLARDAGALSDLETDHTHASVRKRRDVRGDLATEQLERLARVSSNGLPSWTLSMLKPIRGWRTRTLC